MGKNVGELAWLMLDMEVEVLPHSVPLEEKLFEQRRDHMIGELDWLLDSSLQQQEIDVFMKPYPASRDRRLKITTDSTRDNTFQFTGEWHFGELQSAKVVYTVSDKRPPFMDIRATSHVKGGTLKFVAKKLRWTREVERSFEMRPLNVNHNESGITFTISKKGQLKVEIFGKNRAVTAEEFNREFEGLDINLIESDDEYRKQLYEKWRAKLFKQPR